MKKLLLLVGCTGLFIGCGGGHDHERDHGTHRHDGVDDHGDGGEQHKPHDDGEVQTTAEEEDVPPPKEPEPNNPITPTPFEVAKAKAEAGDGDAQYRLGWLYRDGKGVEQDFKEAVKWWQKAADQGHAVAQSGLGDVYYNGEGVLEDDKEAVKWYRKAAEQGYVRGQSNLGTMYYNGRGVEKDFKEAVKWFRKGAEQGHSSAHQALGGVYYRGEGVMKDYVTAYAWYSIAAAIPNPNFRNVNRYRAATMALRQDAVTGKANAAKKMTPAQITEAEALVKEMVKKNPKLLEGWIDWWK